MKKILIISPHYPPSNLAAVHRSRLFAQHLPSFGWKPLLLTVEESFYEEQPDWNLHKLLPQDQQIEKVKAFPVTRPRVIGDIGLRAYFQLRRKAVELVRKEKVDFVYIPIPSFYVSLVGPWIRKKTGVRYGIDYIDPWVHQFPGAERVFSRHWWSTKLSRILEPMAVKKASLITGVAEGYYRGVQERNPELLRTCLFGAMPYGGERADHEMVRHLGMQPFLFSKNKKKKFIYAGAVLPKSMGLLNAIFAAIAAGLELYSNTEFYFVGTGKHANDENGYCVRELAEKYGLWSTVVFEYPKRVPYLDVLVHLEAADAVFVLGSTEPHYTPSKVYQGILSEKPLFAVLHRNSTAVSILRSANVGVTLTFDGESGIEQVKKTFNKFFQEFSVFREQYSPALINEQELKAFSAKAVTGQLAGLLEKLT